ncbi:MAG: hypothetical protein ACQESR_22530 [Planctomycetota bacterium]
MAKCERCGNQYDKAFVITAGDETHTFDCFECAIATLAPECEQCGVKIIGHGLEAGDRFFCCRSCAETAGATGLQDRV